MRGHLVDRCDRCGSTLAPISHDQHRAVEAVYAELAIQADYPPGSGTQWDAWAWHQIMLGLFAEEMGWEIPQFVPTPKGGVIGVMRTKQSRLTTRQAQDLKHFVRAWAANHGVEMREPVCE